jgi:hypothetical protein
MICWSWSLNMVAGTRQLLYFRIRTTVFHLLTIQSKYILALSPHITIDQHNTGIRKKWPAPVWWNCRRTFNLKSHMLEKRIFIYFWMYRKKGKTLSALHDWKFIAPFFSSSHLCGDCNPQNCIWIRKVPWSINFLAVWWTCYIYHLTWLIN